jgi:hypothetical protein
MEPNEDRLDCFCQGYWGHLPHIIHTPLKQILTHPPPPGYDISPKFFKISDKFREISRTFACNNVTPGRFRENTNFSSIFIDSFLFMFSNCLGVYTIHILTSLKKREQRHAIS